MRFEGEFRVPGRPEAVLARFAEVERMAKCMPGASIEGRDEQGNYQGAMLVAFGPKKIKFRGKLACAVDAQARTGRLHVRGAADMRTAARIEVHLLYSVREDPAAASPTSIVALTSDTDLGGVLADFGRAGGVAVTNALMETFAQRVAEEFGREAAPTEVSQAPTESAPRAPPDRSAALSARALLWTVIRAKLAAFAAWLGWQAKRN